MRVQRHRGQPGQALLIFGLTAMVLFALIGLAVDGGVSYFNSSLLERATAASSLAGVTYMPSGWDVTAPPGSVQAEVLAIAAKNGFTVGGGVTVQTCEVDAQGVVLSPCTGNTSPVPAENQVAVKICEPVASSFIRLIGFPATHQECQTTIALYLRPITLGQAGSQLGGDLTSLGGATYKYFLRTEGYATDRGQGDAYTPRLDDQTAGTCNGSGKPYAGDQTNNCWTQFNVTPPVPDVHFLSAVNGTETSVTDVNFHALPANGGYNYQVYIPAGQSGSVQVFNPIFAPDSPASGGTCPGAEVSLAAGGNSNYNLHECDSLNNIVDGTIATNAHRNYYSTMAYTLYKVGNIFDHRSDPTVSQTLVYPISANNWSQPSNQWIEVRNNLQHIGSGLPDLFHNWQPICGYTPKGVAGNAATETASLVTQFVSPLASCSLDGGAKGAYFRLRIDTLDWQGNDPSAGGGDPNSFAHKGSSIQVVPASGSCTGCTVGGLNEMAIFTPIVAGGGSQSFPISLMAVPPEYRGQTIAVDIYDPGDISCTGVNPCSNLLTILDEKGVGHPATLGKSPAGNWGAAWMGPSRNLPERAITPQDCDQGSAPGASAVIETQCDPAVSGNHDIPQNAGSRNIYNGTWIRYYIAVSPLYNPGCTWSYDPLNPCAANNNSATWYWSLQYGLTNASGTDTITFGVSYNGSPVHIVHG